MSRDYETLRTEPRRPRAAGDLNRPEVMNAINTQMGRDLLDLWTRLARSRAMLRCVVLTGAGDAPSAPAATSRNATA